MTDPDKLTPEEVARRRDRAIKRMLETPPRPHKAPAVDRKGKEARSDD